MRLAISPCPNDTFLFEEFVSALPGAFPGEPHQVDYLDIAALNDLAVHGDADVVKVSCAAASALLDRYRLLPCGGAFGFGCGPLLLATPKRDARQVLLPGRATTAHVLFRYALSRGELHEFPTPPAERFLRFDAIVPELAAAGRGYGVVIHETRFTYASSGLVQVADLGEIWQRLAGVPIPLGCVLVHRARGPEFALEVARGLRESLRNARRRSEPISPYVAGHAFEMEPDIQRRHIATYVTGFSLDCGEEGLDALRALWRQSIEGFPALPEPVLEAALEEAAALRRQLGTEESAYT